MKAEEKKCIFEYSLAASLTAFVAAFSLAVFLMPEIAGKMILIADSVLFGERPETAYEKMFGPTPEPAWGDSSEAGVRLARTIKHVASDLLDATPAFEKEKPRAEIVGRPGTRPFVDKAETLSKEDVAAVIENNGGIEIDLCLPDNSLNSGTGRKENAVELE